MLANGRFRSLIRTKLSFPNFMPSHRDQWKQAVDSLFCIYGKRIAVLPLFDEEKATATNLFDCKNPHSTSQPRHLPLFNEEKATINEHHRAGGTRERSIS
jgi:hypothetical protein